MFSALDLQWHHMAIAFDDEVNFAVLGRIIVSRLESVCHKFLCNEILKDGAEIDVGLAVQEPGMKSILTSDL